jgi:hypothetical protein
MQEMPKQESTMEETRTNPLKQVMRFQTSKYFVQMQQQHSQFYKGLLLC